MQKTLVIGGTGFIGTSIVQVLKEHDQYVSVYDVNKSLNGNDNYVGNIKDDINFDNIVSQYDNVIYLITTVSPKRSMDFPNEPYTNDVPLLIKTLDACLKSGIKRIVFASSGGTIYGDSNGIKSVETDINSPINHYAVCKLTCEKILEMYNKLYGMENVALRISNPYGEGQNPKSGVGVITTFAEQIKNGNQINLFGDGSVTRDFVYVKDVAEAFYLATNWDFIKEIAPIFNIGSGTGLSLKQIVEIVSEVLEVEPKINYLPEREFDVKYNVLDISKAQKYIDYKPVKNNEECIKQYVKNRFK